MKNTNAIITLLFLLLILAVPANGQTGSNALSSVNISGIDKERLNRYDDFLKKEIISLEKKYSYLKSKISPQTQVGYKPSKIFKKVSHRVPMLSLSNAFTEEDLTNFEKKYLTIWIGKIISK